MSFHESFRFRILPASVGNCLPTEVEFRNLGQAPGLGSRYTDPRESSKRL